MKNSVKSTIYGILFLFCFALNAQEAAWLDQEPDFDLIEFAGRRTTNDYPVILVGGFLSFGRDEMYGYKYWGGFVDLQEELRSQGYRVYTATVGPVSSNWDRACELYACIRGGRVDYGEAHSLRAGHARYGREYPGLYPEWGTIDPETKKPRKVHLVGHSMGGQTARMLAYLLNRGSDDERSSEAADGRISGLFTGDHDWICGVMTVNSCHNGTSLMRMPETVIALTGGVFLLVDQLYGMLPGIPLDMKLDQWQLGKTDDETYIAYTQRVWDEWKRKDDVSIFDANPEGARLLNISAPSQPNVYYFSIAGDNTRSVAFTDTRLPELGMNAVLMPAAVLMGAYSGTGRSEVAQTFEKLDQFSGWTVWENPAYENPVHLGPLWHHSDGVVNTLSMPGPFLGVDEVIRPFGGRIEPGVWNYLGVVRADHTDVIGIPIDTTPLFAPYPDLTAFYAVLLDLLRALPR